VPLYTKIQAAILELPSLASAFVRVEYSPDPAPAPRTVRHPLGALVRVVLFMSGFETAALVKVLKNSGDSRRQEVAHMTKKMA